MAKSSNSFSSSDIPTSTNSFSSSSIPSGSNSFASASFSQNTKKNWVGENITTGPYGGEESKSRPFGKGVFGGVRHFKK